jgi:hypothetical protein
VSISLVPMTIVVDWLVLFFRSGQVWV